MGHFAPLAKDSPFEPGLCLLCNGRTGHLVVALGNQLLGMPRDVGRHLWSDARLERFGGVLVAEVVPSKVADASHLQQGVPGTLGVFDVS